MVRKRQRTLVFELAGDAGAPAADPPPEQEGAGQLPNQPAPLQQAHEGVAEAHRSKMIEMLRASLNDGAFEQILGPPQQDIDPDDDIPQFVDPDQDEEVDETSPRPFSKTAYQPPRDSYLWHYLRNLHMDIISARQGRSDNTDVGRDILHRVFENAQHYYKPRHAKSWLLCDPREPRHCYTEDVEVFIWLPFDQYKSHCHPDDIGCVHDPACTGKLQVNEYSFRPMFNFQNYTWVFHCRHKCSKCGKTVAGIDPRVISRLPSAVADRYEFVSAGNRRIGMHKMMLYFFADMVSKRVQFGTFANLMNTLYLTKYDMRRVAFYERFIDWSESTALQSPREPEPFSSFYEAGSYNGMLLSRGNVRALLLHFMELHEDYMQSSFQMESDDGIAADHTHKMANVVHTSGREGRLFSGSYTMLSRGGTIVGNRFVFSKSNKELEPIIQSYKRVRDNAGSGKLKVFQSDNLNGDGVLWMHIFSELGDGVQAYKDPVRNDLGTFRINDEQYTYIRTQHDLSVWVSSIRNTLQIGSTTPMIVGLDCEWNLRDASLVRVMQLSFKHAPVGVIHLDAMGVRDSTTFPASLKSLLELPFLRPCGKSIAGDIARLKGFDVTIRRFGELGTMAETHDPTIADIPHGTKLSALCQRYLGLNLDKTGQCADYTQNPLPVNLQEYAASDALVSRVLAEKIMKNIAATELVTEDPIGLSQGCEVHVFLGGKAVARGTCEFVGGTNGEYLRVGKKNVGKGSSLVRLQHVLVPNAKLPRMSRACWDHWHSNFTVADALVDVNGEGKLLLPNRSLRIDLVDIDQSVIPDHFDRIIEGGPADESMREASESEGDLPIVAAVAGLVDDEEIPSVPEAIEGGDGEARNLGRSLNADEAIRSRQQEDLWHQMNSMPLGRRCEMKAPLLRLCIHATFHFVEEDLANMVAFLQRKGQRVNEVLDHFYFNREFWRRRVRMPTYEPDQHASHIRRVHDFVASNPAAKEFYSTDLKDWFESFEKKCRRGEFFSPDDVAMYRHNGTDSNGMDLWLRMRGTVRCENVHQKMRTAMGPWGVGAEVAHALLVLICYRYNVSAGVRRYGRIDFGHTHLHLIDRVQIAIDKIYNVSCYRRHKNCSLFVPVEHVAVGIGPLIGFEDFVGPPAEPDEVLSSDLKAFATRLKVRLPPLEPSGVQEISMINKFLAKHPQPSNENFEALAREFLKDADGIDIFPKLPTQLRAYFTEWKRNSMIKKVLLEMGSEYQGLLRSLVSEQLAADDVPCEADVGPVGGALDSLGDDFQDNGGEDAEGHEARRDDHPVLFQVPMVQAPLQRQYIPVIGLARSTAQRTATCAFYCGRPASECGGKNRKHGRCRTAGVSFEPDAIAARKAEYEKLKAMQKVTRRALKRKEERRRRREQQEEHEQQAEHQQDMARDVV